MNALTAALYCKYLLGLKIEADRYCPECEYYYPIDWKNFTAPFVVVGKATYAQIDAIEAGE